MAGSSTENHDLLVALRHPLRRKILRAMDGDVVRSPTALGRSLGEALSSVSYHVRVLVECSCLVQVKERKVRGATQHFYRRDLEAEWALKILAEDEDEAPVEPPAEDS